MACVANSFQILGVELLPVLQPAQLRTPQRAVGDHAEESDELRRVEWDLQIIQPKRRLRPEEIIKNSRTVKKNGRPARYGESLGHIAAALRTLGTHASQHKRRT